MAKSSVLRAELEVYAKDTRMSLLEEVTTEKALELTIAIAVLVGDFTIYLAGPQADFSHGRFIAANGM